MPVGKRVYLKRVLPEPALIEEFKKFPAANVADVMERSCAMNPRIRLVSRPVQPVAAGAALTVKGRAGDNLVLHMAINLAGEGDFIVVSNEGDDTRSLMGEIMLAYLVHHKKIAGVVLDGPVRDIGEIASWDFPVYCTGTTPGGPYKEGPGEINVPVSCGEVSVAPGDIILADADGVIVIPRKDAPAILESVRAFHKTDVSKLKKAKDGTADRGWVNKALGEKGFEIIDGVYQG